MNVPNSRLPYASTSTIATIDEGEAMSVLKHVVVAAAVGALAAVVALVLTVELAYPALGN